MFIRSPAAVFEYSAACGGATMEGIPVSNIHSEKGGITLQEHPETGKYIKKRRAMPQQKLLGKVQ